MGRYINRIKTRAEELLENYDEAMEEKFSTEFIEFIKPLLHDNDIITYDDIQGFLDSFETLEENEWALAKASEEYEDAQEAKYEEFNDRNI